MTETTNAKRGPEFGRQRLPERFCNLGRLLADVAAALVEGMRPGRRISELQSLGRDVYRRAGMPNADGAFIFFHGLGLSHIDFERQHRDGTPYRDWVLEENMVLPVHLFYPGGERERAWPEEVVVVGPDGGRPLFSWGFEPLRGN